MTSKSKTAVLRWQRSFSEKGVDGRLRSRTSSLGIAQFGPEVNERIVALMLAEPLDETISGPGCTTASEAGSALKGTPWSPLIAAIVRVEGETLLRSATTGQ